MWRSLGSFFCSKHYACLLFVWFFLVFIITFIHSSNDRLLLLGIRQRLDYLKYLGVDAVLLSAFYDSPFEHLGRDVRDFTAVGAKYGSIEDFELLVADLHRLGKHSIHSQLICGAMVHTCDSSLLWMI